MNRFNFKTSARAVLFSGITTVFASAITAASAGLFSSTTMASSEFEQFKQQYLAESESYKKTQTDEFKAYVKAYKEAFADYKKELSSVWGDDVSISDETTWVTHTDDLTTRSEVDFEKDEIRITLIVEDELPEEAIKEKLNEQLTKLADTSVDQAQKEDPITQKVEALVKPQQITPTLPPKHKPDTKPVITLVDKPVKTPEAKKQIEDLVKTAKVVIKPAPKVTPKQVAPKQVTPKPEPKTTKKPTAKPVNKHRIVMTIPLPKTAISSKADRFKKPVDQSASKWKMDEALVLAVIHTESSFNPMARSHIPAYGLMQIVPRSAGQDASALIYGNSRMLTSSYLYTPDKNINVGTAYLHILDKRYLRKIKDPESRLYCVVAAYNTGAGNVARAFTGTTSVSKAAPKINSMTPYQVYNHLLRNLPHDETKDYLKRVTSRYEAYKKSVL